MSLTEKLQQIDQWHRQITEQGKLSDELLKKINYKFRLDWNYYSNSMEGNSLTRQETRSVMVGNITVDGKPIKDVLEMKGHDDVISQLLKMGQGELNVSESRIREIHKAIMHEDDPEKAKQIGQWKVSANHLINYKGEKFDFVAPAEVPERMHKLINWLNTEKEKISRNAKDALHPVLLAFQFHLDYVSIHPFFDGNGRTARIFTNLILIAFGFPPIYIKTEEKTRYYQYLADIQGYGGSPELYYEFMAELLLRSLGMVKDAIEGKEIEEEGDWEKRLILLKQQLASDELPRLTKTSDLVKDIIRLAVVPTIQFATAKFSLFNELFASHEIYVVANGQSVVAPTVSEIEEQLLQLSEVEVIEFHYQLNNLIKATKTPFLFKSFHVWNFYTDKYAFESAMGRGFEASYNYKASVSEMEGYIDNDAKFLFNAIEEHLNSI